MNNDLELDFLLKKMAAEHQPELPSPGLIWWRAQILKKQWEKDLVERPLIIMRWLASAACVIFFVWLAASQTESMKNIFAGGGLVFLLAAAIATLVFVVLTWWSSSEA